MYCECYMFQLHDQIMGTIDRRCSVQSCKYDQLALGVLCTPLIYCCVLFTNSCFSMLSSDKATVPYKTTYWAAESVMERGRTTLYTGGGAAACVTSADEALKYFYLQPECPSAPLDAARSNRETEQLSSGLFLETTRRIRAELQVEAEKQACLELARLLALARRQIKPPSAATSLVLRPQDGNRQDHSHSEGTQGEREDKKEERETKVNDFYISVNDKFWVS